MITVMETQYQRVLRKINTEAVNLLQCAWQQHCWEAHSYDVPCQECLIYQDAIRHLGDDIYAY